MVKSDFYTDVNQRRQLRSKSLVSWWDWTMDMMRLQTVCERDGALMKLVQVVLSQCGTSSGGVVHGAVPVRCSGDSTDPWRDARRRWRRHQVLPDSELHSTSGLWRKTSLSSMSVASVLINKHPLSSLIQQQCLSCTRLQQNFYNINSSEEKLWLIIGLSEFNGKLNNSLKMYGLTTSYFINIRLKGWRFTATNMMIPPHKYNLVDTKKSKIVLQCS